MNRVNAGWASHVGRLVTRSRQISCRSATENIKPLSVAASPLRHGNSHTSNLRWLSSGWDGHGADLLSESLAHNLGVPKIILHGHGRSGFDVRNLVRNMDQQDRKLMESRGIVHMMGSILVFPGACYMWNNVHSPDDITIESLAPVQLYTPKLEYLFLGCSEAIPPSVVHHLRSQLVETNEKLVVEAMDLGNAMGTFNVLNGEDRMVAAALILPPNESQ